ncbi:TPA: hypothetical protein N3A39_004578 [Salmonella enterica subsp. salamae serovar 52:z:z39]|nr:hypothetical protein [Salmonella enterica subsp. salamae serovar 52:z:z39]
MSQPEKPEVTWYGWDGDRLVTAQTEQSRIQTIYEPGGFTSLVRVETGTEALATTRPQAHRRPHVQSSVMTLTSR